MGISKKAVTEFFDRNAPFWDDDISFKSGVINAILDAGKVTEGKSVLDVACGTGILFPFYKQRKVGSLKGIDISPEMVRIAREKHPDVEVICGDAEVYSFEEKFDCIMVHNAFPHFPNPVDLVGNMAGLLKPCGQLTIAHSLSREAINGRHSGHVVSKISVGLMSEDELESLFKPYFDVTTKVSDDEKYIVSGTLRKTERERDLDAENLLMLRYMLDHSRHHMDEFDGIIRSLREKGNDASADSVGDAVSFMREADVLLEKAINLLEND